MIEAVSEKRGNPRRAARSARGESEIQFRRLLEKLPAGAYTCDPEGLITYFNQHAVKVWGRAPKLNDPVDRFCGSFKLFATDGSPIAHDKCWMALALQTGQEYNGHEIVIERPDGRRVTTLAHANPIRDKSGKLLGAVNVLVDISDRKRAEEALKAADRHKDEFLAMLSHELRNPLAPMLTAIELLGDSASNPEVNRRAQEILARQIRRLVRLVDELLDVSRITRGKITLKKETIEVQTAVRRALEPLRSMFELRSLEVNVSLPLHPLSVEGDWVRLEQILGNLLNNAAKYTDRGGKIWITVEQEGDSVVLRVRDNGIGISPEMLPQVFELFEQGSRALDRAEGGLGIGLTLVRNLAELHGGSVEARSEGPGKGSEFIVRLPVAGTVDGAE
jgi:signal transduction histidine kinase